jgi:hypothetical protein
MVACIGRLSPPWSQVDRLSGDGHPLEVQGPIDYVEANTSPGEHVLIIGATADHLVADRAGVVNVSPINGPTALFSPAEVDRALDQLEEDGGTQVFDGAAALQGFARILRVRGYAVVGIDTHDDLRHWQRPAS